MGLFKKKKKKDIIFDDDGLIQIFLHPSKSILIAILYRSIKVWDLTLYEEIKDYFTSIYNIDHKIENNMSYMLNKSGRFIITNQENGNIIIYDLELKCLKEFRPGLEDDEKIEYFESSFKETKFYTYHSNNSIYLWTIEKNEKVENLEKFKIEIERNNDKNISKIISFKEKDGFIYALENYDFFLVDNPDSFFMNNKLKKHLFSSDLIQLFKIIDNEEKVAIYYKNNYLRIIDLGSLNVINEIIMLPDFSAGLDFSYCSDYIFTYNTDFQRLFAYNCKSEFKLNECFLFKLNHFKNPESLIITNNDKYLIIGCLDGIIQIWNLITYELIYEIKGYENLDISLDVLHLAFDEKYHLLYSASNDKKILKFDLKVRNEKKPVIIYNSQEIPNKLLLLKDNKTLILAYNQGKLIVLENLHNNNKIEFKEKYVFKLDIYELAESKCLNFLYVGAVLNREPQIIILDTKKYEVITKEVNILRKENLKFLDFETIFFNKLIDNQYNSHFIEFERPTKFYNVEFRNKEIKFIKDHSCLYSYNFGSYFLQNKSTENLRKLFLWDSNNKNSQIIFFYNNFDLKTKILYQIIYLQNSWFIFSEDYMIYIFQERDINYYLYLLYPETKELFFLQSFIIPESKFHRIQSCILCPNKTTILFILNNNIIAVDINDSLENNYNERSIYNDNLEIFSDINQENFYLITCTLERMIKWDINKLTNIKEVQMHEINSYLVKISIKSDKIFTIHKKEIKIWDFNTLEFKNSFNVNFQNMPQKLIPLDDNKLLICDYLEQNFYKLDYETRENTDWTLSFSSLDIYESKISPNYEFLAIYGINKETSEYILKIWNIKSQKEINHLNHNDILHLTEFKFKNENSLVYNLIYGFSISWNFITNESEILIGLTSEICFSIMSKDGKMLFMKRIDGLVIAWNILENKLIYKFVDKYNQYKNSILLSEIIKIIIGVDNYGVTIYNLENGKILKRIKIANIILRQICEITNNLIVYSSYYLNDKFNFIFIELESYTIKYQTKIELNGFPKIIKLITLEFAIIVYENKKEISIWDLKLEKQIKLIELLYFEIVDIQISPNKDAILTIDDQNQLKIWTIDNFLLISDYPIEKTNINPYPVKLNDRLILIKDLIIDSFNYTCVIKINFSKYSFCQLNINNCYFQIFPSCDKTKDLFYFVRNNGLFESKYFFEFMNYPEIIDFHKEMYTYTNSSISEINFDSKELNKIYYPVLFFNFLHINSLFENSFGYKFQNNIEKIPNIEIMLFSQKDFENNTCFDIIIEKKYLNLLEIYMMILEKSYSNSLEKNLYWKIQLFSTEMILKFLSINNQDSRLICSYLDKSFMQIKENGVYMENFTGKELDEPIIKFENKFPFINDDYIKNQIRDENANYFKLKRKKNNIIKIKYCSLENICDFSNDETKKLIRLILDNFKFPDQIYSCTILKELTRYKWNIFLREIYIFKFIMFLLAFFCHIANFNYILPNRILLNESSSEYKVISIVLNTIIAVYLLFYIKREINQILLARFKYFETLWNIIDILLIIFVPLSIIIDYISIANSDMDIDSYKSIFSLSTFMLFMRLISFLRGFSGTGSLIRLIVNVLVDIRYFLLIIFIFNLGFAFSAHLLQINLIYNHFEFFNIFYRLMMGDYGGYDNIWNEVNVPYFLWSLFIISTILLSIILLNLLISIVSKTYENVMNLEDQAINFELMKLVLELEEDLVGSKFDYYDRLRKKGLIGKYLIMFYNEEHVENIEDSNKLIKMLDKKIDDNFKITEDQNRLMNEKLDKILNFKNSEDQNEILNGKIDDINKILKEIISNKFENLNMNLVK